MLTRNDRPLPEENLADFIERTQLNWIYNIWGYKRRDYYLNNKRFDSWATNEQWEKMRKGFSLQELESCFKEIETRKFLAPLSSADNLIKLYSMLELSPVVQKLISLVDDTGTAPIVKRVEKIIQIPIEESQDSPYDITLCTLYFVLKQRGKVHDSIMDLGKGYLYVGLLLGYAQGTFLANSIYKRHIVTK